ncbi:Uncharacterised protein [Mycolicibacterium vanbaalenii]|uniref:asparaginase n=1 Tax=Mycolicibacterium vanbaalenii TaxID=110539 RepID=A0A5S9PY60_MYCVN|nr:hypothetical protein [Mycolicibacterium vanbaalenii]CAA0110053.1 Uncharacterised protein [Mycolicibacterium vanbaalenii]
MEQESEGNSQQLTEKPEVTDAHKEKARKVAENNPDDQPTTTLPGTGGTVAGTAVTDWVDDNDKGKVETSAEEGNVQYRNTDEFREKLEG